MVNAVFVDNSVYANDDDNAVFFAEEDMDVLSKDESGRMEF